MIQKFFRYTELKTKITSIFTFFLSLAFLFYQKVEIDWYKTGIFFLGMLGFDLTTTAINNYIDSKDNGQALEFKRKTSLFIIYGLFAFSTVFGLYLAYITDLIILLVGGICFVCGIFYTYGPLPISRMPLGELVSGFFYGMLIPFIIFYISYPEGTFLEYSLSLEQVSLTLKVYPLLVLFLLSLIPFSVTANIMLANNICDLEKDIQVKRHTLPYYIGKAALPLFVGLYGLSFTALILMVIFQILSPICLVALLVAVPVWKNIRHFLQKQEKATTFDTSIKNFVLIMGAVTVVIFISAMI
jgi:1,4-dihydroxy-2-naphthoate polyprenyltransferase